MKKIFCFMAMTFCFFSLKAENTAFEQLAAVENSYIEEVLAVNYFATSKFTDQDYLISTFIAENQQEFPDFELPYADVINIFRVVGVLIPNI